MSKWQPISTAPKDGTRILIANAKAVATAGWENSIWWSKCGGWSDDDDLTAAEPPTHWMPLPDVPKE